MSVSHSARVLALEIGVVRRLCKTINTPRSLAVDLLVGHGEWEQLLDLKIDAKHYSDSRDFSNDYQVTEIMKKNPRLPLATSRVDVAIAKFVAAEAVCAKTNERLRAFAADPLAFDEPTRRIFRRVKQLIVKAIGDKPSIDDLNFVEENCRFGPGSTTSCKGIVTAGRKYSTRVIHCTPRMLHFRAFCFPDLWKASVPEVKLRKYSGMSTVPKNAKTDRSICVEPDLNVFLQTGIGALLKQKLLRLGLDLRDQTYNQFLAGKAYDWGLATVDLSAASDTVSFELVVSLLPPAWLELLFMARTDFTRMPDGEVIELEKWSSMGNGYTFELETLIFWAVARAATEEAGQPTEIISVYGDDIILPLESLGVLYRTLDFLGFSVNVEKSFGTGLFHESCGADYFCGRNVRPFYLRSDHHDYESVCYLYANTIRRWARYPCGSHDSRFLPAWLHCFTAVPKSLRFLIPEGFGDCGFVESFDKAVPSLAKRYRERGWAGFTFRYRSVKCVEAVISPWGSYLAFLRPPSSPYELEFNPFSIDDFAGEDTPFPSGMESLRGRFLPPATKVGHVFAWPFLGPWV